MNRLSAPTLPEEKRSLAPACDLFGSFWTWCYNTSSSFIMEVGKVAHWVFPKEGSFSDVLGKYPRRAIPLVSATLTIIGGVIAYELTQSLSNSKSWAIVVLWMAAGIIVTYLVSRVQERSQEGSPEAIKERVTQLEPELRKQVQARSYGARRNLIEAPLRELDLDITPRLGWVRDPRLVEPEPVSEQTADDIVTAFESSKRRMLIVGEPGSGKTIAAYSLIEYLDEREGDERIPLLINLSAWEAQENFEAFLVDYLCSSVGYGVRERAVAGAFIGSNRYALILDGLDEIPAGLRAHLSERLDEFVQKLPGEVGVVVTCRTQEYEQLRTDYPTGLGLVQAVEILPLSSEQLDSAFVELAQRDKDWETFLSQRHLRAYQRVRHLLSNPLFLNLAVVGRLSPDQLLDRTTTEQELGDLVIDRYIDHTLANQRQYEPADARRYLAWVARFLNGAEVSPFGVKTSDYTVFDLADLPPRFTPRRYRYFAALVVGLGCGLLLWPLRGLVGLVMGPLVGLILWLPSRGTASSSHLIFMWPSTREQFRALLRKVVGKLVGMVWPLLITMVVGLVVELFFGVTFVELFFGVLLSGLGLVVIGLYSELFVFERQSSALNASRTPKDARSRSLVSWLFDGLVGGLVGGLGCGLIFGMSSGMSSGPFFSGPFFGSFFGWLVFGLVVGLFFGLDAGGWFVLLQKVAHHRLNKDDKLPSNPYDFLEWGIEKQIFRRVGGGVRFRHDLIQQHLASTPESIS